MREEYKAFVDRIKKEKRVNIYGAGKFAKTLCYFFLKKGVEVDAFIVSDANQNPKELLFRPVIALESVPVAQLSNIVVGFEKEDYKKTVCEVLRAKQFKNIIIVPSCIVDDIYCNFMVDTSSLDTMINDLKKEPGIFVYVNDTEGECIAAYMRDRGVHIKALCTEQTEKFLSLDMDIPLLPYDKLLKQDKTVAVVLAIKDIHWRKSFITRFRKDGFEKIILFPEAYMEKATIDICRKLWENSKLDFSVVENGNVESNHYLTQVKQDAEIYHWRNPLQGIGFCGQKIQEKICTGSFLEDYQRLYPNCHLLACKESPICEVVKPEIILEVYMAKFHKDKKTVSFSLPDWVIPIQVGKELTNIQVAECCDNTGDHISEKNVDYSEGTALYWMWKNTSGQDYIGLFHYRRQMVLGETTLEQVMSYDIFLTAPTFLGVSVKEFFCKYFILDFDWKLMMRYIKEYSVTFYETAEKYEKSNFYFACNIFIMRRKYFDEMCAFIFGVLEKVDGFYRQNGLERKDRYLGYLVENLLSIYVMYQAEKLKITYTDMKFYDSIEV